MTIIIQTHVDNKTYIHTDNNNTDIHVDNITDIHVDNKTYRHVDSSITDIHGYNNTDIHIDNNTDIHIVRRENMFYFQIVKEQVFDIPPVFKDQLSHKQTERQAGRHSNKSTTYGNIIFKSE